MLVVLKLKYLQTTTQTIKITERKCCITEAAVMKLEYFCSISAKNKQTKNPLPFINIMSDILTGDCLMYWQLISPTTVYTVMQFHGLNMSFIRALSVWTQKSKFWSKLLWHKCVGSTTYSLLTTSDICCSFLAFFGW